MRILFICKKNEIYGNSVYTRRSAGLFNSTSFIVKALSQRGIHAHIIEVDDNNDIDRECAAFKPEVVVLEALWVVPEKFTILRRLYPRIKWYIHLHSDMPFLALEGIAMDWCIRCAYMGIGIIANSEESFEALKPIIPHKKLIYLPNVYLSDPLPMPKQHQHGIVNIGCFGAVRPLKNHLLQALAAIQFAREKDCCLRFHINTGRVETGGAPVLKNLKQLFQDVTDAHLIEHTWFEPEDFINHLHRNLDLGMQVSLTETFNVVTADYVTAGLPVVISKEVKWASDWCKAIDNSILDIVKVMHRVWQSQLLVWWNQKLLRNFSQEAQEAWYRFCIEQGVRYGQP